MNPLEPAPVAGRMEMTHADFQRACQLEIARLQEDLNCDTRLVYVLCAAVRYSRECCELAVGGSHHPSELERQNAAMREALTLNRIELAKLLPDFRRNAVWQLTNAALAPR